MSKIGSIFSKLPVVLAGNAISGLFGKKKKTTFINLAPKTATPAPVAKQTPKAETSERRRRIAARIKSGGRAGADTASFNEEDDDVIKRAAARKAKLLGG